ncbi:MAG: amidophosphoribosyltransferase [Actinomycetota bacterium]|nr:amidophosphoribosyltransferase [Actinomycetota bacterium]
MREACGVFGVVAPGKDVAQLTYDGLYALQHRGQESAGMAVSDGQSITVVKDMGLVTTVFDERTIACLPGVLAIGHTRYSTTGASEWRNAQPVFRGVGSAGFALGHNGNLTNTADLAEEAGMLPGVVASDSDLMTELLAVALADAGPGATGPLGGGPLEGALRAVLPSLRGAFSLVLMDEHRVFGVRDPHGLRPLCLGRFGPAEAPEGWALASESPALDIVGATFVRDIAPGELVVIDADGPRSAVLWPDGEVDPHLCIFEFVYFARPDTRLYGHEVHGARRRMGELLATQRPVEADMVMGVPESGVPAAEGYARRSGIPYGQGLVKNRYIGRTFITPGQKARADGVRRKLNPLRENIAGKRIVVVDDSLVRGTTQRAVVAMLRDAGAAAVHLRVSSPPLMWPCFYGIDIPDQQQLVAAGRSTDEIAAYLGVDSLEYLTLEHLVEAIDAPGAGFCSACLTGTYPVPVPVAVRTSTDRTVSATSPVGA